MIQAVRHNYVGGGGSVSILWEHLWQRWHSWHDLAPLVGWVWVASSHCQPPVVVWCGVGENVYKVYMYSTWKSNWALTTIHTRSSKYTISYELLAVHFHALLWSHPGQCRVPLKRVQYVAPVQGLAVRWAPSAPPPAIVILGYYTKSCFVLTSGYGKLVMITFTGSSTAIALYVR